MEIRPFNPDDIEGLVELFAASFQAEVTAEYFRWKYLSNPAGQAEAMLAIEGERIVGFYGMIPEVYAIDGEDWRVHQSMDTMTHPDFQRRGLFTRLAGECYAAIQAKAGYLLGVGFPGETSHRGFTEKLQWSTVMELPYHFTNRPLQRLGKSQKHARFELQCIKHFNDRHAHLFRAYCTGTGIERVMSSSVANWQFIERPNSAFECFEVSDGSSIVAIACLKLDEDKRSFLQALFLHPEADGSAVLRAVVSDAFQRHKSGQMYTFAAGNRQMGEALRSAGFMVNPFRRGPFSYRVPLIAMQRGNGLPKDYLTPERWQVQPHLRDY